MHYKKLVHKFSEKEYQDFYTNLNTISRNRVKDFNKSSLDYVLSQIDVSAVNMVDVGCGNGYLLKKIHDKYPEMKLYGIDIKKVENSENFVFKTGKIENLPFEDNSFDVVCCTHTLEHIINIDKAVRELKRICKKQLIIIVPCQRYFYYTLDEHLHFFNYSEKLASVIDLENYKCEKRWGDWVYIGNVI